MIVRHPTFSCLVHLLLMYGGTSFVTSFSTASFLNSRFHGISCEQGSSSRILGGACYYEFMSKTTTTTTTTSLQATWSNGQGKQVKK